MTFSIDQCQADGWRCLGPKSEELIIEARRVGCDSVLARPASLPKFEWTTKDLKTYMLGELRNLPPKPKPEPPKRETDIVVVEECSKPVFCVIVDVEKLTRAARLDELRWSLSQLSGFGLPVVIHHRIKERIKQIESEVSDGE